MRRGPRTLPRGAVTVAALSLILALGATVPSTAGMRGRMLHLINDVRRAHHEHQLRLSSPVSRSARRHSRAMANHSRLYHSSNVPAMLGNRPWSVWGENIAKARSVSGTFHGWMRSPSHRENILNPRFRHVGIGIYPKGGWLWSTTDFWG